MKEIEKKALGLLGFAARARAVTPGVALTCEALKRGAKGKTPLVVLLAGDASAPTAKRMTDRAVYYDVPLLRLEASCEALAVAVGKKEGLVAAVGVNEPHLAAAICEALAENTKNS